MDRPRLLAVLILLAEVLFAYWLSAPGVPNLPGSTGSTSGARFVSTGLGVTSPQTTSEPASAPQTIASDEPEVPGDPNAHERGAAVAPGNDSGLAGTASPDDVRIV